MEGAMKQLLLAGALALAGCEATGPSMDQFVGTYELVAIGGRPLPTCLAITLCIDTRATRGGLELNADGTAREWFDHTPKSAFDGTGTFERRGRWDIDDGYIYLRRDSGNTIKVTPKRNGDLEADVYDVWTYRPQ